VVVVFQGAQARPFRAAFIGAGSLVAAGALAGAGQLVTGTFTPPVSALAPLGLTSWVLPGVWLFASVALPWTVAVWSASRRSGRTPIAVLTACGLLTLELLVQIPFVGPSVLQAVMGSVALAMAVLAVLALRSGRWPPAVSERGQPAARRARPASAG
jgi:hypothetical protein